MMKPICGFKKVVEAAENIEEAGVELADEELGEIVGSRSPRAARSACVECYRCGRTIPISDIREHNDRYHGK